jgi:diguanylate cyclase (GGDEF)-like protein/PAS domain S-box-containing protein
MKLFERHPKDARDHNYPAYISLTILLTFFLTLFFLFLNFSRLFLDFFSLYSAFPYMDLLVNLDFILLLFVLLVLYRGWSAEIKRGQSNEETVLALQKAVETMQIGVTITDPHGRILYVNRAEAEMHGYQVADLTAKDARILGPPEIWKPVPRPMLKSFRRETVNVRKDGTTFPVHLISDVLTSAQGDIIAVVTTSEDITERRKNEETIRKLAFYDALTGLPNRALFDDRVGQALAKARRHDDTIVILFVDLDRFKNINDTLGHGSGDKLLKAVAERLKSSVRECDTVSRLGGDEFVLLFQEIEYADDLPVIGKKILERMSEAFFLNNREIYITASIGMSVFPADGTDVETLLRNADAAMYLAKEQGRNNCQLYCAAINDNAVGRMRMQSDLRRAVKAEEFVVYYQPQVELRSGRIEGAEALVRWKHPESGLLAPSEFIPLAEETGIIRELGEFLLHTACAQNKAWQEAGFPPIRMSVNISTYQFVQKGFIGMLRRILKETALAPQYLELEFTESIVMRNTDHISSSLAELKTMGISCSIDDFGTGYSSLNYLKYLPINRLKLDQSFVRSLTKDPNDEAISKAIIAMAHDLNLSVTAEGVENLHQLEFLRFHCCDEAQGFLFGPPLPPREFTKLLIEEGVRELRSRTAPDKAGRAGTTFQGR